jgi:multisubunit Na+/H+ antiporter MnhG subunit
LPSGSEFGHSLTALLTLVGVFLGGPVGASMITRTASRSQIPSHEGTILDEWRTIEEEVTESHREN